MAAAATVAVATLAAAGTLTTPASATPPNATYTISVGSTGTFSFGTDSPATPYIDKDGTFYFQESFSQYDEATSPNHYWQFYSGTNFDTATKNTAISDAVDPANPQDSNANTTWRCDNGPTGVNATAGGGYSLPDYCDLIGTWVDPDTGNWYGLVHNEFTGSPFGDGLHYDSIDYAVSTNQGKVWAITGHAITSPYSTLRNDTSAFPNQTYDYGDGDPRLFVDQASGYFYLGYSTRIVPKGGVGGSTDWLEHVARAPMSGKMATGTWQKWYNGSWSQPGVGGLESNVVPVTSADGDGYTPVANDYNPANIGNVDQQIAAGTLPPSSPLAVMNISYDAYLGLYIATPQSDQSSNRPQQFYVTDDLSTQKWYLAGDSGSYTQASWYRWLVDGANATNSTIVGKTFRYYCVIECGNFGGYTDITLSSTSPAAPPVDTSKTYVIANGSGQVLAQVSGSTATTSAPADGSTLQSWSFSSDGDGSFTVTNAATGQVLGVNSASTTGRAWGTAPTATTLSGAPAVGQQWFVIKNTSPAGTFRLVNRYSGLVLGMSSTSGRLIETTPTRNWTNTTGSGVGGTRSAADQTLTFTPSGTTGTPTDLTLAKPTTASSVEPGTSFTANLATDGDAATRWSSAYSDPQWLRVDMGATHQVTEVKLSWEAAYGKAFQIQTSNDGTTWTTIYSTTTGTGGVQDLTGLSGSGRYIRLYGTARGTGYGYSLWSFDAYGT
ncbi:discoidin domain-containing protein [Catenulispora subtropica]|uniref:F5/8 type C domain-containing protein n=1 Tax=Catenulispora subtropica TaxID=450798 RepID=A0ABP5DNR4_9ACTN